MAIGYKRTTSTGDIPVFQGSGGDIQLAQGGFTLDTTGLTAGDVVKAGTPMSFDEETRIATVLAEANYANAMGLNYDDTVVEDNATVSVVIRGTVYARRVPYTAALEAALPHIIYSQSR